MMKLMSNDKVDKLKLNSDEVDTPFAKHVSSENIYILTLRCR